MVARIDHGLVQVLHGDVLDAVETLATASVHCIVTSPPYLDARDYGLQPRAWPEITYSPRFDLPAVTVGAELACLGSERTLLAYVGHILLVARSLRRVLRGDGTMWLNLGTGFSSGTTAPRRPTTITGREVPTSWSSRCVSARVTGGLPAKQLIPAVSAVCDALQADGWWVRNHIVWAKPNAKPDSTRDRCTASHEELLLLAPGPSYYFDDVAIATSSKEGRSRNRQRRYGGERDDPGDHHGASVPWSGSTARPRDVWTIAVAPFRGAHFAPFPPALAERCILAGTSAGGCCCSACGAPRRRVTERVFVPQRDVSPEKAVRGASGRKPRGGSSRWAGSPRGTNNVRTSGWEPTCGCGAPVAPCTVLDPFGGSGTTGLVGARLGREVVLVEAQAKYLPLMARRLAEVSAQPGLRGIA